MNRTDKPKFSGSFVGQVCQQSTLKSKKTMFFDKHLNDYRYGRVMGKVNAVWIWDGSTWILK